MAEAPKLTGQTPATGLPAIRAHLWPTRSLSQSPGASCCTPTAGLHAPSEEAACVSAGRSLATRLLPALALALTRSQVICGSSCAASRWHAEALSVESHNAGRAAKKRQKARQGASEEHAEAAESELELPEPPEPPHLRPPAAAEQSSSPVKQPRRQDSSIIGKAPSPAEQAEAAEQEPWQEHKPKRKDSSASSKAPPPAEQPEPAGQGGAWQEQKPKRKGGQGSKQQRQVQQQQQEAQPQQPEHLQPTSQSHPQPQQQQLPQQQQQQQHQQQRQEQGQATQPDVDAFHQPASSSMQCMQCRKSIHGLGHRSFGDCPEYRVQSRDMRVPPFPCSAAALPTKAGL